MSTEQKVHAIKVSQGSNSSSYIEMDKIDDQTRGKIERKYSKIERDTI